MDINIFRRNSYFFFTVTTGQFIIPRIFLVSLEMNVFAKSEAFTISITFFLVIQFSNASFHESSERNSVRVYSTYTYTRTYKIALIEIPGLTID